MHFAALVSLLLFGSLPAAPAPVRAITIDGHELEGSWSGVDAGGDLLLSKDGKKNILAPSDMMLLHWSNPAATTQPHADRPVVVYLSDGSRLAARITGGDAKHIEVETASVPALRVPLASLAAVRFAAPQPAPEAAAAFHQALANRDVSQDVLFAVRDGKLTSLRGVTESLAADGGSFRWRDRSVPIRADSVYGIVFAAGVQQPPSAATVCVLTDGSAWAGRIIGGDATAVHIEIFTGAKLALPVAELSEIQFRSDRVVFLSNLKPASYAFEPFGTTRWPYRLNRSVANNPLRMANQTFQLGIGMHSQSKLVYDLPDRFANLAASIGIDDAARPRGNCVFRVIADGKEAFNSGPVTGRNPARSILVPINGAKQLQLTVEFGEELDVGDQADWGNVRLIK